MEEAVEELHYVPNAAAQSLARGSTKMVALIVPDITSSFFTTVARGVEDAARRQGFTLILGNTDETTEQEQSYVEVLRSRRVDGVILIPSAGSRDGLERLQRSGIPVVLVDRGIPGAEADFLRGDSYRGGRLLTDHLLEHGYRGIASMIDPFLTVVKQPAYDMGAMAMEMLIERIQGSSAAPRDRMLPVELIVRKSSAPNG